MTDLHLCLCLLLCQQGLIVVQLQQLLGFNIHGGTWPGGKEITCVAQPLDSHRRSHLVLLLICKNTNNSIQQVLHCQLSRLPSFSLRPGTAAPAGQVRKTINIKHCQCCQPLVLKHSFRGVPAEQAESPLSLQFKACCQQNVILTVNRHNGDYSTQRPASERCLQVGSEQCLLNHALAKK